MTPPHRLKSASLQAVLCAARFRSYCLPCRRSWVRIPSAALEKACICRSFCWSSSPCSSASGRTDSGLAAGQSPAASRKTPGCRPILVRPNRSPSAGLQKVEGSPAAAVTPTPAATARSCGQRPPARYQRSRSLGPVRFQSGNREVHLGPLRDPPCHLEPCVSPHGPEAAARCPTTRGLSPGSHTSSSTCRFSSGKQASAPTRSGLLLIVRSGRQPDGARECSLQACCLDWCGDVRPRGEGPTGGELTRFQAVGRWA